MNVNLVPPRFLTGTFISLTLTMAQAAGAASLQILSCKNVYLQPPVGAPVLPNIKQDTPFNIRDLKSKRQDPSKVRSDFKLQLNSIFQTIENFYGPKSDKKLTIDLNWTALKEATLKKADSAQNSIEEYEIITELVEHFSDSHVSVSLPSTLTWSLPLQLLNVVDEAGTSKLLVNYVSPAYPANITPPTAGDELISINGMDPDVFRSQYRQWNSEENTITSKSLFALTFGRWSESRGLPLSTMKMSGLDLVFKKQNGATFKAKLKFTKSGVGLIDNLKKGRVIFNSPSDTVVTPKKSSSYEKLAPASLKLIHDIDQMFHAKADFDGMAGSKPDQAMIGKDPVGLRYRWGRGWSYESGFKRGLGDKQSFFNLPADFQPMVLPDALSKIPGIDGLIDKEFFTAGTFLRDGKKVGFLRIPSYAPADLLPVLPALRFYIAALEANSDYLVIDQTNNPGGYVILSDLVIKSLTGQFNPKKHLRFAVKPTESFLRQYADMIDSISKNQDGLLNPDEIKDYVTRLKKDYRKILEAVRDNRELSRPISMTVMSDYTEKTIDAALSQVLSQPIGLEKRNSVDYQVPLSRYLNEVLGMDIRKPQVYTKPVYFMVNETDFSGGDATPASLQDYERVRIVGAGAKRTAGAGGTVEEFSIRAASEMILRLTTSLMVRYDGQLVEQYGVRSDLDIPLRDSDVRDGFKTYFDRVMEKVSNDVSRQDQPKK